MTKELEIEMSDDDFDDIFDNNPLSEELEGLQYGTIVDETTNYIMITPKVAKRFFFIPVEYYSLELTQEMHDKGFYPVLVDEDNYIFGKMREE